MIKLVFIFWSIVLTSTENHKYEESLVRRIFGNIKLKKPTQKSNCKQVRLIEDEGYAVEVHKIFTEDDYILTVFRLPSKLKNPKVVYIMHGIRFYN